MSDSTKQHSKNHFRFHPYALIASLFVLVISGLAVWAYTGVQDRTTPTEVSTKAIAPIALASDAQVEVFTPRTGQWIQTLSAKVKPGSEFIYGNHLYRLTDSGKVEIDPYIEISKLADSDKSYDKTNHRRPEASDVVQVLDKDMRILGHAVLGRVDLGTRICFLGRAYDLKADRSLVDTGIVASRVVQTFKRETDALVDLKIRSADGKESVVTGTLEHPFYVPAVNDYVAISKLTPGTVLKTADDSLVTVVGSTTRHGSFDVYNFEVDGQHNYYISDKGVLVHNHSALIPAPKELPEVFSEFGRAKPKTPVQGGGGLRPRWKTPDGKIMEWDSQHGTFEMYNRRGVHLGEFGLDGSQTKPAIPGRRIEP